MFPPVRDISKEIEELAQPTKGRVLPVSGIPLIISLCIFSYVSLTVWRLDTSLKVFLLVELMKAEVIKQLLSSEGNDFGLTSCILLYLLYTFFCRLLLSVSLFSFLPAHPSILASVQRGARV